MYNIKFNLNNQEINIPSDNNINKNISDNLESHNTNINSHTDIRTQLGNFGGVNTNYDFFDTLNLDWTYAGKIIKIGGSSNKTQIINLPDLDGNQHCTQMIHILYDQGETNYNTITIKAPTSRSPSMGYPFLINKTQKKEIYLKPLDFITFRTDNSYWFIDKHNDNYIIKESLGNNGYRIWNTGWCEQWGIAQNNMTFAQIKAGNFNTTLYNIPFIDRPMPIFGTLFNCYGQVFSISIMQNGTTTNNSQIGFTWTAWPLSLTDYGINTIGLNWKTQGYVSI